MIVGQKVTVIEQYDKGDHVCIMEHDGEITQVTTAFIETKHRRDELKYPGMGNWGYEMIWVKHYGETINIK